MPEKVTYDLDTGLIRVRAWGQGTIDEWNASKTRVLELHARHGASMLLVDTREQQKAPNTAELFDFGTHWPREIRLAILVGESTKSDQHFLETVAVNRGLPIRIFSSEVEALAWLRI